MTAALHDFQHRSDGNALIGVLSQFDRRTLASAVEVMIALMDAQDGDPDLEDDDPDQEHDGREPHDSWRSYD